MDLKFGHIIEGEANRDAVHVAVAPMVAYEKLFPGQDAGILENGIAGVSPNPIGIVDPYLKSPVFPGQKFWLFLYPNTVTGMRHHWNHPAFGDVDSIPVVAAAPDKAKSEEWMRNYAEEVGLSYDSCMDAIRGCDEYGNTHIFSHDTPEIVYAQRYEMWKHYEIITGKKASDKKSMPFSARKKPTKAESEKWLRDFCETNDCPRYETLMKAIRGESIGDPEDFSYTIESDYFTFYGTDAHADIPAAFWDHIENVTGIPAKVRPPSFTCSC